MKPQVVDPSLWSEIPRKIVVDLSSVKTFDDFTRAMKAAFPLDDDPLEIWVAIRQGLAWQTSPLEVRFDGWAAIRKRDAALREEAKGHFSGSRRSRRR